MNVAKVIVDNLIYETKNGKCDFVCMVKERDRKDLFFKTVNGRYFCLYYKNSTNLDMSYRNFDGFNACTEEYMKKTLKRWDAPKYIELYGDSDLVDA